MPFPGQLIFLKPLFLMQCILIKEFFILKEFFKKLIKNNFSKGGDTTELMH